MIPWGDIVRDLDRVLARWERDYGEGADERCVCGVLEVLQARGIQIPGVAPNAPESPLVNPESGKAK